MSNGSGTQSPPAIPPLPQSLGGPAPSTPAAGYDPNGISAGLATTSFTLSGGEDQSSVQGNGPAAASGGFSPPVTYNVQDWLTSFGQMDSDHLQVWQNKLEAAGLLTAGKYTRGYADDATMAAIQQAIVESIRQGTGLLQVLDKRVVAQGSSGTNTSTLKQNTATNVVNLTNPDAINKAADDAAVKELGRKATDKEKAMIVAAVHGLETSQQTNTFNAQVAANRNDIAANQNNPTGTSSPGAGASDLDKFMAALGGQESGDPNATNPDSGAHGMYQIMPSNWAKWAVDAGLPANAPQTAANQEIVARNKVQQYYKEFGNWSDVAKAWYAGEGFKSEDQNAPQGGGKYPSINAYASSVVGKMGGAGGSGAVTGSSPGVVAATPTQTVEQIASSPTDTADAQIRAMNPVEAGAHDISNVFGNFMSILNKAGMG